MRNSNGIFKAAIVKVWLSVNEAVMAKALCFKVALSRLKSNGSSNILTESDVKIVVNYINSKASIQSPLGSIISDCIFMLSSLLNSTLCFIKRSVNFKAHNLVKASNSVSDSMMWIDYPPPSIFVIFSDL